MKPLLAMLMLMVSPPALAQSWQKATDGRFVVETSSPTNRERLGEVFEVLRDAALELRQDRGWALPRTVTVRIYPTFMAYTDATRQPWYVAGTADRNTMTLHVQRLRVLLERGSLERTLRHELFHLAQPAQWPRWRAEGSAMRFAGEAPSARPFTKLNPDELDRRLAEAGSRTDLARAAATAWLWASRLESSQSEPDQSELSSAPKRSSSP